MLSRFRFRRFPPELLVLSALAALTRFWGLFHPHAVIFDEVYYEKFTGDYLTHTFYVDVHPPLAEQIFTLAAKLFHVPASALLAPSPTPVMRIVPALAGALIIPVFYVLLRRIGLPRALALFGGLVLLFDNALLAESRALVPDSMLILFNVSAMAVFFGARRRSGAARWWGLAAAALLAGLAVSTKWTGLSALGVIGVVSLVDAWKARVGWRRYLREAALLVAIPVAVYLSVFVVHFSWQTHYGKGLDFMSGQFRTTLVGSPTYNPKARMSFFAKLADMHGAMQEENDALIGLKNGAASKWYQWPTIQHPFGFWIDTTRAAGYQRSIYLEGNPVVWYGVIFAVIVAGLVLSRRRALVRKWKEPLAVLGLVYAANFVPFMAITRLMYQYAYFMAFIASIGLATLGLGLMGGWAGDAPTSGAVAGGDEPLWHFPSRRSAAWYWALLALVLIGFLYYSPLTYGWTTTKQGFDTRFWLVQRHY